MLLCNCARYKQGTFTRQFYGAVLTADICGFTSLTERSAASKRGLETVEELMIAVNNYFNELIDTAHRHGGDVVQFAGDCMIVVFESEAAARLAGERLNALGSVGNGRQSSSLRDGVHSGGENGASGNAEAGTVEVVERATACGFELISSMGIYTPLLECYGSVPLLDRDSVDGLRRVCAPTATGGSAFVIRVLVVCVDTLQQVTLAKMLSKLSCQTYFVSTRDAAVGLILQHAYHVVIVNEGGENASANASASAIIMAVRTSRHCKRAAVALLQSGRSETETEEASGLTDRTGDRPNVPTVYKSNKRRMSTRSSNITAPRYFPDKRGSCLRRRGRHADFMLTSPVTLTQLTTLLLNCTGFLQYFDSNDRNMLDAEALLRSGEKQLMSSLPSAGLEPGMKRRLRVLVVDDSPINRLSISHMLSRMDCEVELAGDGEEAVRRVRDDEPPYSFVMMDVQMARMDGCQATRLIRRLPDTRRAMVPIAAITSHTNSHRRCHDAGMDIMLPKPIKHEGVMKILRSTVTDFSERVAIKVLVVDDNLVVLRQLSMLLEQLGCDVSRAANGLDALKIVQPDTKADVNRGDGGVGNAGGGKNGDDDKDKVVGGPPPKPFDIILIDLLMPGMSGMELAHRLRALNASGHNASLITPTTYMCAITATAGNLSLCYDMGRG